MSVSRSCCVFVVCWLLAVSAQASPAMIAPSDGAQQARESFQGFAEGWIAKAMARGERESDTPRARSGSAGMIFTYESVGEDFETEIRSTGRPSAPWVGVLHYTERTFTCADALGNDCRVTSSLPVTEIFRFRDGRWTY